MGKWHKIECCNCPNEIDICDDWNNPPTLCKECIEVQKAKTKIITCAKCPNTFKINRDWNNPPTLCKECIEKQKAKTKIITCSKCPNTFKINTDWNNPPTLCKECFERDKENWYIISCIDCNSNINVRKEWDKPCTICKSCLIKRALKWSAVECDTCGHEMYINEDWNIKPTTCKNCRKGDINKTNQKVIDEIMESIFIFAFRKISGLGTIESAIRLIQGKGGIGDMMSLIMVGVDVVDSFDGDLYVSDSDYSKNTSNNIGVVLDIIDLGNDISAKISNTNKVKRDNSKNNNS